MRPNIRDRELFDQLKGRGREHRHPCRFANIHEKVISCLGVHGPSRPPWKGCRRDHLSCLCIN